MLPKDVPKWIAMMGTVSMSSYNTWNNAGLSYFEEEDFVNVNGPGNLFDEEQRLVDHLPLAALQATDIAIADFCYQDNYGPWQASMENADGVCMLDAVQVLVMGKLAF